MTFLHFLDGNKSCQLQQSGSMCCNYCKYKSYDKPERASKYHRITNNISVKYYGLVEKRVCDFRIFQNFNCGQNECVQISKLWLSFKCNHTKPDMEF